MKQTRRTVVKLLVVAGLLFFLAVAIAGDLQPPGAPGSTMKTLDEVEPRIGIHASDFPLTISEPNSYYLVKNVNFASTANHAITIECNDVTIDLMGYTLRGPGSGTKAGIYMNGCSNVEIRNGTIRNFGDRGIHEVSVNSRGHRVINVRLVSNGRNGIRVLGFGHLIKDCTVRGNGSHGISAYYGCTVTGNIAYDNRYAGISVDGGSTMTGNTAYENDGFGIVTSNGCTATGNTTYYNHESGISCTYGSTVIGNTVSQNNQLSSSVHGGIRVSFDSLVKGNTVTMNNQNNIYVSGTDNAIEENLVTDSTVGINFVITGNFYANNRASGNTTDYGGSVPTGASNGGGNASF